MFLAAGDGGDVDVRSERAILLGKGDPFAVGRDRDRSDAIEIARRHDCGLAIGDGVVVELLVGSGVEQRLRIG